MHLMKKAPHSWGFLFIAHTHCAIIINKLINNGVFKKICLADQSTMCNIFSIKIFNGWISMMAFTVIESPKKGDGYNWTHFTCHSLTLSVINPKL